MGDKISEKYDTPKYILKKSLEDRISNKILYRKKVGFPVPIDKIMLGKNKKMVRELIMDGVMVKEVFDKKEVENIFKSGVAPYNNKIWSLFNLEVFHSKYFKS
jgi:asparagine synthase (glutamine-hydrolysing)